MTTGIRYPATLPPPSRDAYAEEFEEIHRATEMEAGTRRKRARMRVAPRRFDVGAVLSQTQFAEFDRWWQDTIKGGEREFDIELLDDDDADALVWYTVRSVDGSYDLDVTETATYRVSFVVRAVGDSFATRPSGTDELEGRSTLGLTAAPGRLLVFTPFRALSAVGITGARSVFNLPPLQGRAEVGLLGFTRGQLAPLPLRGAAVFGFTSARGRFDDTPLFYYPEASRQWQNYDWIGTIAAQDINTAQEHISREWLENP